MRMLRLVVIAFIAALVLAACGGGDDNSQDTLPPGDNGDTTTTTAADPGGGGDTTTTTAGDSAVSDARIDVDPSALPTDPSGLDTLSGDWCAMYEPADLDAFFLGVGDIAEQEDFGDQCRWSVAGFPNTHFVSVSEGTYESEIEFITSGLDGGEKDQLEVNGYTVYLNRGLEVEAYIEVTDVQQIRLVINGDYDGPGGFWRDTLHFMDPATDALLDNITSRL